MPVGAPRTFQDKFAYTIEVDGVSHAKFNKCSTLAWEFDEVAYREGGDLIPTVKDPGLLNFDDVTLERGAVFEDSDLFDWMEQVADAASNTGLVAPNFKRGFDIVLRDRDGTPKLRWRITDAWPKRFEAGDWDSDASEKTVEKVVLSIRHAKRIPV